MKTRIHDHLEGLEIFLYSESVKFVDLKTHFLRFGCKYLQIWEIVCFANINLRSCDTTSLMKTCDTFLGNTKRGSKVASHSFSDLTVGPYPIIRERKENKVEGLAQVKRIEPEEAVGVFGSGFNGRSTACQNYMLMNMADMYFMKNR